MCIKSPGTFKILSPQILASFPLFKSQRIYTSCTVTPSDLQYLGTSAAGGSH